MTSNSIEQTTNLAKELARNLIEQVSEACIVLRLHGELGAGKTTFVQALGKALGVVVPIVSPSYVYVREYKAGELKLVHVDAWRVEQSKDFWALGISDYIQSHTILAVEWPKKFLQKAELEKLSKQSSVAIEIYDISFEQVGESRNIEITKV